MLKIYKKITKMKKLLKLINLLQNSYSPTTIYDCSIENFFETECSKRGSIEQIFESRVIVLCLGDIAGSTYLAKALIISTSAYANIRPRSDPLCAVCHELEDVDLFLIKSPAQQQLQHQLHKYCRENYSRFTVKSIVISEHCGEIIYECIKSSGGFLQQPKEVEAVLLLIMFLSCF